MCELYVALCMMISISHVRTVLYSGHHNSQTERDSFIDLEARASAAVAYRRRNRHIVRSARRIFRRAPLLKTILNC